MSDARSPGASIGAPGADLYLLHGSAPGRTTGDAVADIALAHALLRRLDTVGGPPVLRVYRPSRTVAFGRVDAFRPGFVRAADAAREHGFVPVIRGPGGRAAAYHERSLVLDVVGATAAPSDGIGDRFVDVVSLVVEALRHLGVEARSAELPAEYCPGAHSVVARTRAGPRGAVKLGGPAQRVLRRAWHVSVSLVVEDAGPVREVLADVYDRLGYPLDPSTVGAAIDAAPGVTVAAAEEALLAAWGRAFNLVPRAIDATLVIDAAALAAEHAPRSRPHGPGPSSGAQPGATSASPAGAAPGGRDGPPGG